MATLPTQFDKALSAVEPDDDATHARDAHAQDVDVFARLTKADGSLRPGAILDHVAKTLDTAFPGNVERQHRSVKVDFPEYDPSVDVVIARPCGNHWEIPQRIEEDGRARWRETNPTRMTELTTEANKS